MSKALVAYFSASGATRTLAKELAKAANADLFEIEPEQPYTAVDLDWINKNSRSTLEMNDPNSRPLSRTHARTWRLTTRCMWASPSGGTWRPPS